MEGVGLSSGMMNCLPGAVRPRSQRSGGEGRRLLEVISSWPGLAPVFLPGPVSGQEQACWVGPFRGP